MFKRMKLIVFFFKFQSKCKWDRAQVSENLYVQYMIAVDGSVFRLVKEFLVMM